MITLCSTSFSLIGEISFWILKQKKKKNVDVSIDDSKWMNSLLRFIILMLVKKTDEERKKYNADKMITPV